MSNIEELKEKLDSINKELWTEGFIAGYHGRDCLLEDQEEYLDGYSRGYATSESESGISTFYKRHSA